MSTITEADVEQAALDWLSALGWRVVHGPGIAPEAPNAEHEDYGQVVLERRVRDALAALNTTFPSNALDDAFRKLTRPERATMEARNRAFHRLRLRSIVPVTVAPVHGSPSNGSGPCTCPALVASANSDLR